MAEEYSVSLNVDSKEAAKGLQAVEKEVNALDKEFQELVQTMDGDASKAMAKLEDDMLALAQAGKRGSDEYNKLAETLGRANQAANLVSKDIENLSVASNDVSAQISVLEDRLYEMALAGKKDTEEFKQLVGQVGKLKKTIAETDIAIERASTTTMDLGQQVGLLEDQLYQMALEGKKDTEEFKKLARQAGELKQKMIDADMAVEEFAATNADLGQKVGILTDKMYRMASAGDMTSKEFMDTAREAAAAQAQITRVDMALEAMAMTGAMRVQTALGGVQGAFDFANGAMNLFGLESEKAQKMMMKFQAVMQMTAAVTTMQQALPAITAIKNNVINGFNSMTQASKAFMVTGVGLVIAAVGVLVAYWDDIKQAIYGVGKAQEKLEKQSLRRIEADKKSTELLGLQENSLRLQGKTEAEIRKIKMDKLKISIKNAEVDLELAQKRADAENKAVKKSYENTIKISRFLLEMMTTTIRLVSIPIDALIWGINKASELMGKGKIISKDLNAMITDFNEAASKKISKFLFDPEETKKKNEQNVHEAKVYAAQLKDQYAQLELEIRNENKKTGNSRIDNEIEVVDKLKEIEEQRIKNMEESMEKELAMLEHNYKWELKELEDQLKRGELKQDQYDQLRSLKLDAQKLDEAAIRKKWADKSEDERAKEEQAKQDALDKELEAQKKLMALKDQLWLEEQQKKLDQFEYEKLVRAQKFDEEMAQYEGNAEIQKLLTQKYVADIEAIEDKAEDARVEKRKRTNALIVQGIQDTLTTIANLNELFAGKSKEQQRKAFKLQQAVQVAQAVMDTYKAANTALQSAPPPYNFIAAAAAVTAGLINVKKIMSQKFDENGTPPTDTAPAPASITSPQFNVVGNSNVSALAQLTGQPLQAYVVSGDVTTAQALDRQRISNATL